MRVFPADSQAGIMTLYPEQNYGSFFETQHRYTWLYQWAQELHVRPVTFAGRHLFTLGYALSRATYDGAIADLPVDVLREDHTLASEITFEPGMDSGQHKIMWAVRAGLIGRCTRDSQWISGSVWSTTACRQTPSMRRRGSASFLR
jgi:hypothetical protein